MCKVLRKDKKYSSNTELFYQAGKKIQWIENSSIPMPEILLRVPWRHQTYIVSKCKTIQAAMFYLNQVIEGDMSRSELQHIIDANLYEHKAKALNNFGSTLPQPQGSLAEEMIKDPYNLDFISMDGKYDERDLENKLADNVTRFLLEFWIVNARVHNLQIIETQISETGSNIHV